MDAIKIIIQKLKVANDKNCIVELLSELNELFVCKYMVELDEQLKLYPIEVESYYYDEINFPDTCVHSHPKQINRYGKLYFHRAGKKDGASFLFDGGGIDVCLSDSNEFYLGVLIRGAWINDEAVPICTPGVLAREVIRKFCNDNSITKVSGEIAEQIEQLENQGGVLKLATKDVRDKESLIYKSTRFGINPKNHPEYSTYKLRTLIELSAPKHNFKAKEKVVIDFMKDNEVEPTLDNICKVIGYRSNSILQKLKVKV